MAEPAAAEGSKRRAVLFGAPVGRLQGVLHDVARMERALGAWRFSCTRVVDGAATRDGILGALRELVAWAGRVGSEAVVVIYYGGHGAQSRLVAHEGARPTPKLSHLVPVDIAAKDGFHGVAAFELAELLDELTAFTKNVTVILDCCYAAAIRSDEDPIEGLRGMEEVRTVAAGPSQAELLAKAGRLSGLDPEGNPHVVRLVATGSASLAYEGMQPDGCCGGYFTYELCKALGEARELRWPWQTIVGQVRERVRASGTSSLQHPAVSGPRWRLPFLLDEVRSAGEQSVLAYDARTRPWMRTGRLHGLEVGDRVEVAWVEERQEERVAREVAGKIVEVFDDSARLELGPIVDGGTPPTGSAVIVREAGMRKRVRVDGSACGVEGLLGELATSLRLERVEEGPSDFVVALEDGGLVVSGPTVVRRWPQRPTRDGIAALVDDVDGLARSAILLDVLDLPRSEARGQAALWEVDAFVTEGTDAEPRKLVAGETLPEGVRIYVEVRRPGRGGPMMYVSVLDRGVSGRIELVNDGEPRGVQLGAEQTRWIGRLSHGGPKGLRLEWPRGVPRGVEGWEELLVVVSDRPLDPRPLLERPWVERGVRAGARQLRGEIYGEVGLKLRWIVCKIRFRIEPAALRTGGGTGATGATGAAMRSGSGREVRKAGDSMASNTTTTAAPSVLLAFADSDPRKPLRSLAREDEVIREVLEPLFGNGKLDDRGTLWHATAERIAKEFRKERHRRRCRAFHFGGHASDSTVMLANVEGDAAAADAGALAQFLGQQEGLELVVLNGCGTQPQIAALHAAGIKAVIATTCAIFDDVAADFAAQLYAGLVHRPLRQAFEEAKAVVGMMPGKNGSTPRELVKDGAWTSAEWGYAEPWVLSCAGDPAELDGWWLWPRPKYDVRVVVAVLSRLFASEGDARFVTRRAGMPPAEDPPFPNALRYWEAVVDVAVEGRFQGGIEALLREATARFPFSEDLARLQRTGR